MNATLDGVVIAAFLAFCRIGGCFMLMPGLSSARVPMQIRLFVAIAATFGLLVHLSDQILPFVSRRPDVLAPMIISEVLVGALIGVMARLYIMARQFMGSAIAMLIGFSYALWAGLCVALIAFTPKPPTVRPRAGLLGETEGV